METTAYALLAQMALGRLKSAGPIVTWLSSQRDPQGGFVSTQVRAIQNCLLGVVGELGVFFTWLVSSLVFTNDSSASIIEFVIGFKLK